ncbi:hypothetical protein QEZ40_004524 [Streptomyces katrae]|uniref:DUF1963 domain-containing protein n=1 Tax=Streptomyces katrae TaxID=68223 RepID=A0ABT7GQA6_9ACTN|nr:hypothetical protein [Streptomyces katrae]MDK9495090.1 hypothetical protein [Streptomyces katrae]
MNRTTPPRPVDIAAVFPQLAPLARPAIRLHPRPGSPTPHDSSVGGPLLWPADEPWPHCEESHDQMNDLYEAYEVYADEDYEWQDGPNPLVPVAQLYVRDVPVLRPPGQADVLQVLWCPFEHEPDNKPPTALFWRSSTEVADTLTAPPSPFAVEYDGYIPRPCVLAPEQITEYPNLMDLSKELQQQLGDWNNWQAVAGAVDSSRAPHPDSYYGSELSVAPGWKAGGWPRWGLTDPISCFCTTCDARMVPLLQIASCEWDGSNTGWVPYEDRELMSVDDPDVANPPKVQISRSNRLQLYVCPQSPDHPHTDLIQ